MQPMYKTQNRQTKEQRPWSVLISRKRGFQIGKEEVEENEAIKIRKSTNLCSLINMIKNGQEVKLPEMNSSASPIPSYHLYA